MKVPDEKLIKYGHNDDYSKQWASYDNGTKHYILGGLNASAHAYRKAEDLAKLDYYNHLLLFFAHRSKEILGKIKDEKERKEYKKRLINEEKYLRDEIKKDMHKRKLVRQQDKVNEKISAKRRLKVYGSEKKYMRQIEKDAIKIERNANANLARKREKDRKARVSSRIRKIVRDDMKRKGGRSRIRLDGVGQSYYIQGIKVANAIRKAQKGVFSNNVVGPTDLSNTPYASDAIRAQIAVANSGK